MPKQSVAQQYQGVIKALIPFAARGKLMEGLNKFSARIEKSALEEIKYEVNRLISPCNREASNKLFARGTTSQVKIGDVKVQLDEIGKRILQEELKTYNDIYSEGVFEAISSERRYQEQVRKENHQRTVEAFSVDCIVGNAPQDYQRMKVVPEFTVSCESYENGKPQSFHFLSKDHFAIHTNAKPKLYGGEEFGFIFPAEISPNAEDVTVDYICKGVKSLPGRNNFSVLFKLKDNEEWAKNVMKYIKRRALSLPLISEQEEHRTRGNLIKDAVISNMPYIATLCSANENGLIPEFELRPRHCANDNTSQMSLCMAVAKRLSSEFKVSREVYQFQMTQMVNGTEQRYVASLRELVRSNMLATFIQKGKENGSLRVIRLNLVCVDDEHVYKALVNVDRALLPGNEEFRYIIYSADVTHELDEFSLNGNNTFGILPKQFIASARQHVVQVCLPDFDDRRKEPRFEISTPAVVKAGWLKKMDANVVDISREGLRIRLNSPLAKVKDQVSVSVPSLGLQNIKYVTIGYDPITLELRLAMTFKSLEKYAVLFDNLYASNYEFFNQRSSETRQQRIFDYFWQMISLSLPGVHILLGQGKEAYQQLIVAQSDGQAKNMTPFKLDDNKLETHGWFADGIEGSLCSERLTQYNQLAESHDRTSYYINKQQKTFKTLDSKTFEATDMRQRLYGAIKNKKGSLIVHSMTAHKYDSLHDNWYKRRCKHLQKVDKVAVTRLKKSESECHRILSIFPVSNLHQNILLVGSFKKATSESALIPSSISV